MPAQASTNAVIQSAVAQAAQVGDDATWVSAWSSSTGGTFLWREDITNNPAALQLGDRYQIAVGGLTLTQPNATNGTAADARRAVEGRVSGGFWLQWHDGDPGTAGTANVISGLARTQIQESQFTVTTS